MIPLTRADWSAIGRASLRWADDAGGAEFRAAVEAVVRRRLALAWRRGYSAGWSDGVSDAVHDEPGPQRSNPFA